MQKGYFKVIGFLSLESEKKKKWMTVNKIISYFFSICLVRGKTPGQF